MTPALWLIAFLIYYPIGVFVACAWWRDDNLDLKFFDLIFAATISWAIWPLFVPYLSASILKNPVIWKAKDRK